MFINKRTAPHGPRLYIISESVFLLKYSPRFNRHVSAAGEGLRLPKHDQKGDKGSEKITYSIVEKLEVFQRARLMLAVP